MAKSSSTASSSTNIVGLLGVAFVVLKLIGVINWSWWWVTAPFWGGLAIGLVIIAGGMLIAGAAAGVLAILESRNNKRIRRQNRKRLKRIGR